MEMRMKNNNHGFALALALVAALVVWFVVREEGDASASLSNCRQIIASFDGNTTTNITTKQLRLASGKAKNGINNDDDNNNNNNNNNKIAMVMRVVNPIRPDILQRIVEVSKIIALQQSTTFANYELVLLSDETQVNGTARLLQDYWTRRHLHLRQLQLPMPRVFAITEAMIREEFPAFSDGFLGNATRLVNGETGTESLRAAGGRPAMWQLMVPSFVVFFHYNRERYTHAWIFEDDVGSVGADSLVELFPKWDEAMGKKQRSAQDQDGQDGVKDIDLAAIRTHANGIPFNLWIRRRQTYEFLAILQALGMSEPPPKHLLTYHKYDWISWNASVGGAPEWTHEMRSGKRTAPPKNDTEQVLRYRITGSPAPRWTCVSEAFCRHSREFSDYLYRMLSRNVFHFSECYQQPVALSGDFKIADLAMVLTAEEGLPSGLDKMSGEKTTPADALAKFMADPEFQQYATHLYHEEVPKGIN